MVLKSAGPLRANRRFALKNMVKFYMFNDLLITLVNEFPFACFEGVCRKITDNNTYILISQLFQDLK